MSRPHSTRLEFAYDSPATAETVARSVRPEVGDIDDDRTVTALDRDGAVLTVTVDAADLTALRAGLNTWTTLVATAESVAR